MRRLLRTCRAIALSAGAAAALAAPGDPLHDDANRAYWWGDFAALEALRAQAAAMPRRADGTPALDAFRSAIRRVDTGTPANDNAPAGYIGELVALTAQWAGEHPQSPLAQVLHARALHRRAWVYRGTGWAKEVPLQSMAEFERGVDATLAALAAHADVALRDPLGWELLVSAGRDAGWPRDRLWQAAQQGLDAFPDDDELYFAFQVAILPRWGGTPQALDRWIGEVVERTRARWGTAMYARLYRAAARDEFGFELFRSSGAQWPKMQQGFRDLLERWPAATHVNSYAYFACMAEDKSTLLELLPRIGTVPDLDRWGSNAARTFETCKRWAERS